MSMDCASINTFSSCSESNSTPGSPKSRVKFTISHGGRILPNPLDFHLKYVGGETRVISIPPDISFQELMKKLTYSLDGEASLKYKLVSEDLDALVTVKSDEDLHHMLNEIARYETVGAQRLRAFIFPANPPPCLEKQLSNRYVDAINGIVRLDHTLILQQHPSDSSACSSPKYSESDATNYEPMNELHSFANMNFQSSPRHMNNHVHQLPHMYCQNQRLIHHPCYSNFNQASNDPHDGGRYKMESFPQYYHLARRKNRGSRDFITSCQHRDEFNNLLERRIFERSESYNAVRSNPLSPRGFVKAESLEFMRSVPSSPRYREENGPTLRSVPSSPAITTTQ